MRERIGSISEKEANFKIISLDAYRQRKGESGEKPVDPLERIPFDGFKPEQEANIKDQIRRLRFPLDNITAVNYRPELKRPEIVLGSYQPFDGTLTLYKSLEDKRLEPIAQQATLVHELGGHGSSPFDPKNAHLYGSQEALEQTQKYVTVVAQQTAKSGKYLNGYHAYLFEQLAKGKINQHVLLEETHAILVEMGITKRKQLAQVEEAQLKALERRGIKGGINLLSKQTKDGWALSGVDATIMRLTRIGTYEGLEEHVKNVRESVMPKDGKPVRLLSKQPLAQAA